MQQHKEKLVITPNQIKQFHALGLSISQEILKIYEKPIKVTYKSDNSPLSLADQYSNTMIVDFLKKNFANIPVLSEEMSSVTPYNTRKQWTQFWLVDPLDGTKEFIKKNGQFCICIALIEHQNAVFGFIHAPVTGESFYAIKGKGAFKIKDNQTTALQATKTPSQLVRIIGSLSHSSIEFEHYIQAEKDQGKKVEVVQMGSALKFCLIAQGKADTYPRFGPTMEWDTAAGQIIVEEAGKQVISLATNSCLDYNKENLKNPFFIVK